MSLNGPGASPSGMMQETPAIFSAEPESPGTDRSFAELLSSYRDRTGNRP